MMNVLNWHSCSLLSLDRKYSGSPGRGGEEKEDDENDDDDIYHVMRLLEDVPDI